MNAALLDVGGIFSPPIFSDGRKWHFFVLRKCTYALSQVSESTFFVCVHLCKITVMISEGRKVRMSCCCENYFMVLALICVCVVFIIFCLLCMVSVLILQCLLLSNGSVMIYFNGTDKCSFHCVSSLLHTSIDLMPPFSFGWNSVCP